MLIPFESAIGNTPLIPLKSGVDFFAKLEGLNLFGSMKDRAALYLIKRLLQNKTINKDTTIIESSSGNFAVSVAGICNSLGIAFTCVSDPLMNTVTRKILEGFGTEIITIDEPDQNNIYVTNRIRYIKKALQSNSRLYWINQYDNRLIIEAYNGLASELLIQCDNIDYIFIPVSSGGTISGVSSFIKEARPSTRIIAVDLDSSSIFQKPTTSQKLPAMGFNTIPGNLRYARIDDVVIVDELSCIYECRKMAKEGLMVGPSSGSVISAIKRYGFDAHRTPQIVGIFPDKGDRYLENVFSNSWCEKNYPNFKTD